MRRCPGTRPLGTRSQQSANNWSSEVTCGVKNQYEELFGTVAHLSAVFLAQCPSFCQHLYSVLTKPNLGPAVGCHCDGSGGGEEREFPGIWSFLQVSQLHLSVNRMIIVQYFFVIWVVK